VGVSENTLRCIIVLHEVIHEVLNGKAKQRYFHEFVGGMVTAGEVGFGLLDTVKHSMGEDRESLEHRVAGRDVTK
jgi:hypothetical protein